MTEYTRAQLLGTKKQVLKAVDEGQLSVESGAKFLGITRQGLWKMRERIRLFGWGVLEGRKRGPSVNSPIHNKTPEWAEEVVEQAFIACGGGIDNLIWVLEDNYSDRLKWVELSRSTIYRILVRRRLHIPGGRNTGRLHLKKYAKGYPGEEIQIDTTEPFGKCKGTMLSIIDDHSRYMSAYIYKGGTSLSVAKCFEKFLRSAPFPVMSVRTDNGSEFKKDFVKLCKARSILIRRNPPKTPQHNGKVERLHRTIEEECLWKVVRDEVSDLETVQYRLNIYAGWYNTKRRHGGYKMHCTPRQKIEQWIINNKANELYEGNVNETLVLYNSGAGLGAGSKIGNGSLGPS